MTFRFGSTQKFDENLSNLPKELLSRAKKELRKLSRFPIQSIKKRSPFLKGEFAGIRHYSADRLRIYLRICEECIQYHHDSIHGRCKNCSVIRADDLIVLFDIQFRRNDTYKKLIIDKGEIKPINP